MSDPAFSVVPKVPERAKKAPVKTKVSQAIPYLFANLGEWCELFRKPTPNKVNTASGQYGCHFRVSLEIALQQELAYHSGSYDVESKRHIALDPVTGERYTGVWFRVSYNELNEYANGTHKYHDLGLIAQDLSGDLERAVAFCDLASELSQ